MRDRIDSSRDGMCCRCCCSRIEKGRSSLYTADRADGCSAPSTTGGRRADRSARRAFLRLSASGRASFPFPTLRSLLSIDLLLFHWLVICRLRGHSRNRLKQSRWRCRILRAGSRDSRRGRHWQRIESRSREEGAWTGELRWSSGTVSTWPSSAVSAPLVVLRLRMADTCS